METLEDRVMRVSVRMIVLFVLAGVLVGAAFATVFGDNLGTLHIQDARESTATATDISAPAVPTPQWS